LCVFMSLSFVCRPIRIRLRYYRRALARPPGFYYTGCPALRSSIDGWLVNFMETFT